MGDVLRVLSSRNEITLQSLMHERIVVEACENIHFHWRNLRVEMSVSDAARMVDVCWRFSKIMTAFEGRVFTIPLDAICPYDNHHMRMSDDEFENDPPEATAEHKAGIAWMVEQIKAGRKPRPIAVHPAWGRRFHRPRDKKAGNIWQRLDGFKRYMAHQALQLPTIDCFLVAADHPGCQHGLPAFLDEEPSPPAGLGKDVFIESGADRLSLVASEEQRRLVNEVELLRNGTIHLHLGDIRLEFQRHEFLALADLIRQARAAL
jgi:hypothetical protein